MQAFHNDATIKAHYIARIEALTDFCQSLFGLNEFVYVD